MPSARTSALLKTVLIPPLAALCIYVLLTYLLLPYYRKYRERSSYSLLPTSLNSTLSPAANTATSLISRLVQKLSNAMLRTAGSLNGGQLSMGVWRRDSGGGGADWGFGVGDEELAEGIVGLEDAGEGRGGERGGRRLSRELESGFISDSSEEDVR